MNRLIRAGYCFGFLIGLIQAQGSVIFSDSFNYADGSLFTNSSGVWGHHSGTTGELQVVSGRAVVSQTNSEDVFATLQGQPYGATTNVSLYAAFTINVVSPPANGSGNFGTNAYFAHFKDSGTANFRDKLFILTNGVPAGFYRVGVSSVSNSPSAVISSNLSFGTSYTLVTRYTASNAACVLWLNPGLETDPGVSAADAATAINVSSFALRESLASANGMGTLFLDDLVVGTSFSDVVSNQAETVGPTITNQPQDQTVTEDGTAVFSVSAAGDPVLSYQWRFNGNDLSGSTDSTLTISPVSTNQAGLYTVVVTNGGGSVTSNPAMLTVNPLSQIAVPAITYVTYNMKGNGATNWSTNAPQVQAIGHELMYLNPDIITFNEIPNTYTYEMTNFINAFLPGYYLATNSATDGFIRNGIASRFPILSSRSYLHSANLDPYGYTNSNFTRDLFEAQIAVPNFAQRLHVFVVHLKSGQDTDSSSKRSAEAAAISNFFVTVFLATNVDSHPYILSGDMNEDINDPPSSNPQSIQKLISAPTGLQLTTPLNPFTSSRLTFSIQSSSGLSKRYDYIMPCPLMLSDITSSQVFRTDLLPSPPPPLQGSDDSTGSDHLPVQMVFSNPYDKPFRITSFVRSNQNVSVQWQSIPGQPYRVEASSNLSAWTIFRNMATATAYSSSFSTNAGEAVKFVRVYRLP